jgi:hypothetical protein
MSSGAPFRQLSNVERGSIPTAQQCRAPVLPAQQRACRGGPGAAPAGPS